MTHAAIAVFLKERESTPLIEVQKVFSASGTPAVFRFGTEGDASDADLANARWDAAYLCWTTPVIHETWMLERALSTDEDGQQVIAPLPGNKSGHQRHKVAVADVFVYIPLLDQMLENREKCRRENDREPHQGQPRNLARLRL